jgi:hypothetical protein
MRVDRVRRLACERRGLRGTPWRRLSRGHGLGGGMMMGVLEGISSWVLFWRVHALLWGSPGRMA